MIKQLLTQPYGGNFFLDKTLLEMLDSYAADTTNPTHLRLAAVMRMDTIMGDSKENYTQEDLIEFMQERAAMLGQKRA